MRGMIRLYSMIIVMMVLATGLSLRYPTYSKISDDGTDLINYKTDKNILDNTIINRVSKADLYELDKNYEKYIYKSFDNYSLYGIVPINNGRTFQNHRNSDEGTDLINYKTDKNILNNTIINRVSKTDLYDYISSKIDNSTEINFIPLLFMYTNRRKKNKIKMKYSPQISDDAARLLAREILNPFKEDDRKIAIINNLPVVGEGFKTFKDIQHDTEISTGSLQKSLNELCENGFVIRTNTWPARYNRSKFIDKFIMTWETERIAGEN